MKFAAIIVLSLLAVASAGPAFNKNNQIQSQDATGYKQQQQWQQQQQQQMGATDAKSPAIDILKQWCFSSQMSPQELTASFKKLVQAIKSNPNDQVTETAVMNERICQGTSGQFAKYQQQQQQQQQTGYETSQTGADAKAHELIKDVYMDALISANTRECTQKLLKVVESQQVDPIRASYYMTRIAVSDKESINDAEEIEQFAKSFVQQQKSQWQQQSEAIERQKLFATTALIAKWINQKPSERQQIEKVAQEVAKTIVERYIQPVSQQEVEQYKQSGGYQQQGQQQQQQAKKIAKRNAALKALANIPGHVLKQCPEVEQTLAQLAQNKQELNTVRQSAIECFEQNDKQTQTLKQLAFDQEEPIEVRVAAYRALMTSAYAAGDEKQSQEEKKSQAQEIVNQVVKHCENEQNQQQDDQFVLYAISHLDNVRTSQQPEHQAIKETIQANKQHYMQIQVLAKKFKQQLNDVRRSSRNYKLAQEFNQLESGLVLEGDLVYESKQKQQQQQQPQILPKLIRVNMSLPIMGETVNVVEITLRQNQMDEEILSALKMVSSSKFNSESMSKMVDSFKSTVQQQQQQQHRHQQGQQQQQQVEADLTIKVDGCTIVYLCADDFKTDSYNKQQQHQRNTRSIYTSNSIVDDIIEYLKRQPVAFNRGFNFNINERLAKVLDVDANVLAGLRFESRAQGHKDDFEIVAQMEPRFSFEAVVGPAKMSSKKLLQRLSTKTACGLRLRFKKDQLVDVQVDLPMNTMELFTVESQLVERSPKTSWSYNYLPESIYGSEDIYSVYSNYATGKQLSKRSIVDAFGGKKSGIAQLFQNKGGFSQSYETPQEVARATGLNGKLRVAASPRDMSMFVQAVVEKYEPEMQGYRMKVEKSGGRSSQEQATYMVSFDTPGSRTDRAMQMRLTTQSNQQRSLVKADIECARQSASFGAELVHDSGRQYSIKTQLTTRQGKHTAEAGLIQSGSNGRLNTAGGFSYKPYVQIESTSMKRPVQLQGQVAYSQSPKSVISYELKCPTTGSYVQGKLIFEQRDARPAQMRYQRRSMQSPIEMIVNKDLTLTNEFIAQINKHAVKVHNMLDWDCDKYTLQGDAYATYKNVRQPSQEQKLQARMKLDAEQQVMTVERVCPQDTRKEFTVRLDSKVRPTGHQMEAECRYNGRQQSSVLAYKHKVDVRETQKNHYDAQAELELVDTERQIAEKATARARLTNERKMKQVQAELNSISHQASARFQAEYQSSQQHQMKLEVQSPEFQHKCELRNTPRQFYMQSRTEQPKTNQVYYRMQAEVQKESPVEAKIQLEVPQKSVNLAADLKLAPGKRSSLAYQGKRFASNVEFTFDDSEQQPGSYYPFRVRSSLKDLAKKQAYWMDSQLSGSQNDASFMRFDSPFYRSDIEYEPRSQEAKFAAYARSKAAQNQFNSIYSNPMVDSIISQTANKLKLDGGKLWMLRSIVSSPFARDQLKKEARRALVEYADRRQNQRHSFEWSPFDESLQMDSNVEPNVDYSSQSSFEPIRMKANVSTRRGRPSSASLESGWMSADLEAKPFFDQTNDDDTDVYAKISALSRHRRSAFKKHESEVRYNKDEGYKAYMKHHDSRDKRHELRAAASKNPTDWTSFAYDSDKHGKTNWSHKWRQHQKKRAADNEQVYGSEFSLTSEGPAENKWKHETSFKYEEPSSMVSSRRHRRSVTFFGADSNANEQSTMNYLKKASARLQSKHSFANDNDYNRNYQLDFDYQPQSNYATLSMDMPNDMQHWSSVSIKPSESLYKIQSRLFDRRNNQPTYDLLASTKPGNYGKESYVYSSHPMLEGEIDTQSLGYQLLKQPLKLAYSDKYGRSASFDYDHNQDSSRRIGGLSQKRASVFYKNNDFQHSSNYDFYPESLLGKTKSAFKSGQMSPVAIKANTKYGPIMVRAESNSNECQLELESPLMSAKLQGQTGANKRQLYTIQIDNKQQRVQLAKLVRENAPKSVRECKMVKEFARTFDNTRFEQQAEILASITEQIFKIKSQTKRDGRQAFTIEAEWNEPSEKAYAKINGERVQGQAAIDLARYTGELRFDAEEAYGKHGKKESLHHYTRLVQTSQKFYTLESMTTAGRQNRPVFKMNAKVSTKVFEPEHLFGSRRGQSQRENHADHLSTFEAVIYEPKEILVQGQFDCENKEARVTFHNAEEQKTQTTTIKYDDDTQTFYCAAQLNSQHEGQIYAAKAKINLPGLFQAEECQYYNTNRGGYHGQQQQSCSSEAFYQGKQPQQQYSVQYYPGDMMTVSTPYGKSSVNMAY